MFKTTLQPSPRNGSGIKKLAVFTDYQLLLPIVEVIWALLLCLRESPGPNSTALWVDQHHLQFPFLEVSFSVPLSLQSLARTLWNLEEKTTCSVLLCNSCLQLRAHSSSLPPFAVVFPSPRLWVFKVLIFYTLRKKRMILKTEDRPRRASDHEKISFGDPQATPLSFCSCDWLHILERLKWGRQWGERLLEKIRLEFSLPSSQLICRSPHSPGGIESVAKF